MAGTKYFQLFFSALDVPQFNHLHVHLMEGVEIVKLYTS